MNPNEDWSDQSGELSARQTENSSALESTSRPQTGGEMKRALVKQLIEKYYYQLTDGCGQNQCTNEYCASSPDFSYKCSSKNELAVHAVALFKSKAKLCENQPSKVPKIPNEVSTQENPVPCSSTSAGYSVQAPELAASAVISPSSFASNLATPSSSKGSNSAFQLSPCGTNENYLTESIIKDLIKTCKEEQAWSKLIKCIGATFNNSESLMKSFLLPTDKEKSEPDSNGSTRISPNDSVSDTNSPSLNLDIESVRRSFQALMEIPDMPFQGSMIYALCTLSKELEFNLRYHQMLERDTSCLNIFVICMEIPMLSSPEFIEDAFPQICKAIGSVPLEGQARLAQIWASFGALSLANMVQNIHQLITVKIVQKIESHWSRNYSINDDIAVTSATKVMKILYYASIWGAERESSSVSTEEGLLQLQGPFGHEPKEVKQPKDDALAVELKVTALDVRNPLVPYADFINDVLNEHIDLEVDYKYKLEDKFSFMNHCFILTTASKHRCLNLENKIRMYHERRTSIQQTIFFGETPVPYLRLRVHRDHLIDDALVNLEMIAMDNPQDLKKQLIVEFDGEQGLDEGGVSKEFFQLVVEEIFNPDFGMFTYNEASHHFWFNPMSFENDGQFTLIGIVLGLAIYNNTIVDVHFPLVVYRKLMGRKGTLADLADIDPTIASSLEQMLKYQEEDFSEIFMQTFCIGFKDMFGTSVTHNLIEDGDKIMVTQENKQKFVELYVDYLLNKSIEKQFNAFLSGFLMVTNESPLKILFRPEELELLICGSTHCDFKELEESTEYDGGFTKNSPTIKHFWEVVHSFSEEQKRKLLQFTTGTDRVPVGGLSKLRLIIARNGPDSDRLPTAHTCFNVLLLPDYSSKDKLCERLLKAINYSKGFGML